MSAPAVRIALVTCPRDHAGALALARSLVETRVAACVSILPGLKSVYRWQGKVQEDDETLMLIKFPADGFEALRLAVVERHPADVPEVIAIDLAAGHLPYLDWVIESCR